MFELIYNNYFGLLEVLSKTFLPIALVLYFWVKWHELWKKKYEEPIDDFVHNLKMTLWDSKNASNKEPLLHRFFWRFLMIVLPILKWLIFWIITVSIFYMIAYMNAGDSWNNDSHYLDRDYWGTF